MGHNWKHLPSATHSCLYVKAKPRHPGFCVSVGAFERLIFNCIHSWVIGVKCPVLVQAELKWLMVSLNCATPAISAYNVWGGSGVLDSHPFCSSHNMDYESETIIVHVTGVLDGHLGAAAAASVSILMLGVVWCAALFSPRTLPFKDCVLITDPGAVGRTLILEQWVGHWSWGSGLDIDPGAVGRTLILGQWVGIANKPKDLFSCWKSSAVEHWKELARQAVSRHNSKLKGLPTNYYGLCAWGMYTSH